MRGHRIAAVAAVVLLPVAYSPADSPPFNAQIELHGSATYNPDPDGIDLEPGDWDVDVTVGATQSLIAMGPDGIVYTPGELMGVTRVQHQHKRWVRFERTSGSAFAGFRLVISNIQQIGFCAGFFATTPLNGEPSFGAYFRKPASGPDVDKVDLVTADGTENVVRSQLMVSDNTPFDIVVQLPGRNSHDNVTFWWKQGAGTWNPVDVSANVPSPLDDELRFSVRVFTDEDDGTSHTMTAQVFELRSPVLAGPTGN